MAFNLTSTVTGLGTFVFNLPATDSYTIQGTLQLPNQIVPSPTAGAGGGAGTGSGSGPAIPSQVVTVVKKNASTIYTSSAGDRGFIIGVNATAGDTISVITSSSLAQDQASNSIQCTVAIWEGEAL